ncbi:DMT family transporter [Labrys monachus]|uniref:Drug/metabolite transporter (DMT)-like permease n=1 Tax=Labrys monachus TaxID=217067 RepID=A0ABU0FI72_9HYPH|nr:DMT family transporter [Labrys monachus]MDQ0394313.1 drug/metabolite transporter (DMT)-like permease [Labrys monachus]
MSSLAVMPADAATQRANQRGILLMIAAMGCFLANDTFVKLGTALMPSSEIMALRGVSASLFVFGLILANGMGRQLHRLAQGPIALRGCIEVMVALSSIVGLAHVPIGTATAVGQTAPLILLALSALVLKESVGRRRWLAVLAAFAGVVLVAHPTARGLNLFVFATLLSASLTAMRDIATHRMAAGIPTLLATLGTTIIVSLAGFAGAAVETWQPLSPAMVLVLLFGGFSLAGGHALVIAAYRGAEVSVVTPFRYSSIALSVPAGLAVFGDRPDLWAGTGMALIAATGLYTAQHEFRRRRAIEAALAEGR